MIRVGSEIATRANNLQARIDRLAVKVVQMDGNQEEREFHYKYVQVGVGIENLSFSMDFGIYFCSFGWI
jgi:ribose 5-phosphate isomerase RpiB